MGKQSKRRNRVRGGGRQGHGRQQQQQQQKQQQVVLVRGGGRQGHGRQQQQQQQVVLSPLQLVLRPGETPREAMNRIMESITSLQNEKWHTERSSGFIGYEYFFTNDDVRFTYHDFKFFKRIGQSAAEPSFYRALALSYAGRMSTVNGYDCEGDASTLLRGALLTIERCADKEQTVLHPTGTTMTVGAFFEKCNVQQKVQDCILLAETSWRRRAKFIQSFHETAAAAAAPNPRIPLEDILRQGETLREAKRRLVESFQSLDTWVPERCTAMIMYGELVFVDTDPTALSYQDIQVLKRIGRSRKEPWFFRAMAKTHAGCMSFLNGLDSQGDALKLLDDANSGIEKYLAKTDDEQKERIVYRVNGKAWTVESYLETHKQYVNAIIECASNAITMTWALDGSHVTMSLMAGLRCDCCGERRPPNTNFHICGGCKMNHYCNETCQETAWTKHGHRKMCRKKGDFRVGDLVMATDEECEHQCRDLRIKGVAHDDPDPNNPSRFEAEPQEHGNGACLVLPADRLLRVRSGHWNAWDMQDIENVKNQLQEPENQLQQERINRRDAGIPDLVERHDGDVESEV